MKKIIPSLFGEGPLPEIVKKVETPASAFQRFWDKYPRHVAKAEALKAWAKLAPDVLLLEEILKALDWQCRSDQWLRGHEYIPHAATYLRGRRWEDEQPPAPQLTKKTSGNVEAAKRFIERGYSQDGSPS